MFVISMQRTREYRTRRTLFGFGKNITEERVIEQIFSINDPAAIGEQWSRERWERVNNAD